MILDVDLAALYGVSVKRLNEQVRRNVERFPSDFAFRLSPAEFDNLRSHFATSRFGWGGRRYMPTAFTEHGAIMVANVLSSRRAVAASVAVVRAFVRLRRLGLSNSDLARRIDELEARYDAQFKVVFDAIRALMEPAPARERRRIGFRAQMLAASSEGA